MLTLLLLASAALAEPTLTLTITGPAWGGGLLDIPAATHTSGSTRTVSASGTATGHQQPAPLTLQRRVDAVSTAIATALQGDTTGTTVVARTWIDHPAQPGVLLVHTEATLTDALVRHHGVDLATFHDGARETLTFVGASYQFTMYQYDAGGTLTGTITAP